MNNSVLEFDFDSAEDFINTLMFKSSIKDSNIGFASTNFVFRGERSVNPDFKLLPAALRLYNRVMFVQSVDGEEVETEGMNDFDYVVKEFSALYHFYRIADKNGIVLPEVQRYTDFEQAGFHFEHIHTLTEWIPDDLLEIAGIAQHYGIPTRLLDWSYNPFTALYFAAIGAVEEQYERLRKDRNFKFDANDKIVVWALNAQLLNDGLRNKDIPLNLKLVRPMYYRNPNLAAQQGIFTHWKIEIKKQPNKSWGTFPEIDRMPLDERLRSIASDQVILYKFMIPISESNRVLSVISKIRHAASRIFPGLGGVARETNDMQKRQFIARYWPLH